MSKRKLHTFLFHHAGQFNHTYKQKALSGLYQYKICRNIFLQQADIPPLRDEKIKYTLHTQQAKDKPLLMKKKRPHTHPPSLQSARTPTRLIKREEKASKLLWEASETNARNGRKNCMLSARVL